MHYIIINFVEIHQWTYIHIRLGMNQLIELENPSNYYYYLQNPKDTTFFYEVLKELKKNVAEVLKKHTKGDLKPYSEIREAFFGFIDQDKIVGNGSSRIYEVTFEDGAVHLKLIKIMDYTDDNIEYKEVVGADWEEKPAAKK